MNVFWHHSNLILSFPLGESAGNFTVLSGMGANLRTALNSQNIKMYDDRTARFDSPFQTGNCGGDGTCGTCVVAVLSGMFSAILWCFCFIIALTTDQLQLLKHLADRGLETLTILSLTESVQYWTTLLLFDWIIHTLIHLILFITTGKELMNDRVRVEEGALKQQLAPPNYRWACRIIVAPNSEQNGIIKIKLRPQTTSW